MQQQQKARQKMEHLLDYELNENENLLWQGRPKLLHFTGSDVVLFLIGLPWTVLLLSIIYFQIVYLFTLSESTFIFSIFFFTLLSLPGLILLTTPLRSYLRASRTIYGITDQRILFITQGRQRSVRSYIPTYIGNIERIERRGERGDLIFGLGRELHFIDIPNVRSVEQILLKLRNPFPHR